MPHEPSDTLFVASFGVGTEAVFMENLAIKSFQLPGPKKT